MGKRRSMGINICQMYLPEFPLIVCLQWDGGVLLLCCIASKWVAMTPFGMCEVGHTEYILTITSF